MRWTIDGGLLSREPSTGSTTATAPTCAARSRSSPSAARWCRSTRACARARCAPPPPSSSPHASSRTSSRRCSPSSANCRRAAREIWAVSSTCDWVVEEGMRRFDIPAERILAARVAIAERLRHPHPASTFPPTRPRSHPWPASASPAPDAVFGNSIHDAAMLAIARRAFPIDPSPALLARCAQQHWPVYYPASVAPHDPKLCHSERSRGICVRISNLTTYTELTPCCSKACTSR